MDIIKQKGKEICLFRESEETNILRYNALNKSLMVDSEIGSDLGDVAKHIDQLKLTATDPEKFSIATENLYMLFSFIENEINIKQQAFAVMVGSINGVEKNDISQNGLKRTLKELDELGLTQSTLKKKLMKYRKASEKN